MALSLNNNRAGEGLAYYQGLARTHPWWLIPIPFQQKAPIITGWPQLRLNPVDFRGHFNWPSNAGVLLGVPCTNGLYLIDVDLDSPEAVQLADQYLPPTDCVFGRQSKPASHRFYYVRHPIPTKKYTDSNKKVIVELRGAGCQTVVPGSEHPSGERIEWVKDAEPAEIDPAKLLADIEELAEACGWRPPASVVPVPTPQPVNGNLADRPVVADAPDADWYGRCQKYLEKVRESISGQRGHDAMLRACCEAYRFGLDDSAARQLADWFNAERCTPPWNAREIEHKLSEAKKLVDEAGEFGTRRKPEPHTLPPADAAPQTAAAVPVPDWEPMPLDCLPEVVRNYVEEHAAAIECAPEAIASPLFATLASLIGNSRCIRIRNTWREPCVVWACVAMPSGTRKSPAHEAATGKLLDVHQKQFIDKYEAALKEFEAAKEAYENHRRDRRRGKASSEVEAPKEPVCRELYTNDTTVEAVADVLQGNPRGLLVHQDELAAWFKSFDRYVPNGGGDLPRWLRMHGARALKVNRKTFPKRVFIDRAAVSVCGTIQPKTLQRCLTPETFDTGLTARFLFVMPPKTKRGEFREEDDVSANTSNAMKQLVKKLLALEPVEDEECRLPDPGPPTTPGAPPDLVPIEETDNGGKRMRPKDIPLSDDAKSKWSEFYTEHGDEQHSLDDENLAAAWPKMEGYTARFALIFTLCDNPGAEVIDGRSMHNAIRLMRWYMRETIRVYAMLGGKPDERANDAAILKWLAGRGGAATLSELRDFKQCYRAPDVRERAVDRLIAAGHVVWDIPDSGPSGGRPPNRFRLAKA
jgi:hypothetical protein